MKKQTNKTSNADFSDLLAFYQATIQRIIKERDNAPHDA
jgi:hypothetical protein